MTVLSLLIGGAGKGAATFAHNWPYLLVGIVGTLWAGAIVLGLLTAALGIG
jgi:hypothetical protein